MRSISVHRLLAVGAIAGAMAFGGSANAADEAATCDGIGSLIGFNSAPLAVDDEAWVRPNGSVAIEVLANDVDFDDDKLVIEAVTRPSRGEARIEGATIVYSPGLDAEGNDTFTYRISDGGCGIDQAQVRVQVSPIPPPPDEAEPSPPVTEPPTFTG